MSLSGVRIPPPPQSLDKKYPGFFVRRGKNAIKGTQDEILKDMLYFAPAFGGKNTKNF